MANPETELRKLFGRLGWAVESVRKRRHLVWRLIHTSGARHVMTTSRTPSDHRAWENIKCELRKALIKPDDDEYMKVPADFSMPPRGVNYAAQA